MVRRKIMNAMLENYMATHGEPMPDIFQEFLIDLITKVARLSMEPRLADTWHDIQGYAKLAEDYLYESGEAYELQAQSNDEA